MRFIRQSKDTGLHTKSNKYYLNKQNCKYQKNTKTKRLIIKSQLTFRNIKTIKLRNKIFKNIHKKLTLKQQTKGKSQIQLSQSTQSNIKSHNDQIAQSQNMFLNIRQELVLYIRDKCRELYLSRQGYQLSIHYMDKYYENTPYKMEQQSVVFLIFFILSSKMTDLKVLSNLLMAPTVNLCVQQINRWQKKVLKTIEFQVFSHTYVQDLNGILVQWDKNCSLKFYQENIQSYTRNRHVYYLFDYYMLKSKHISKSEIKLILRLVLQGQINADLLSQILKTVIPETIDIQLPDQVCLKSLSFTKMKPKIQKDFQTRHEADNYFAFVNYYK